MTPLTLAILFGLVALALFVAEIFLPSHGLLGSGAALATIVALIFCFTISVQLGVILAAAVLILSPFAVIGALRIYPYTLVGRRMTLRSVATTQTAPASVAPLCPGAVGVALSDLRPIGVVDFDGARVEVISDQGHLPRDSQVIIAHIQNNRPTVRPLPPVPPAGSDALV